MRSLSFSHKRCFWMLVLAWVCLNLPLAKAHAQNQFDLGQLKPGQTLLNLSITQQAEVDQDQLTAVLRYSTRGSNQTELQEEVNRIMAQALALLEDSEGLEYATQRYQVYAMTPPRASKRDLENPSWQAQQSLRVTGTDSALLLDMAGRLQKAGLEMVRLDYSLSPEKHRSVSDNLLAEALESLQAKADETARLMGKSSAALLEVSLDNSQNVMSRHRAMPMAAAESADFSAPVAEPGKTTVSITVSARALLSP